MVKFKLAQMSEWAKQTQERMDAIVAASTERLLEDAQLPVAKGGNMPVDTGTLRGSLRSSLNGGTFLSGAESYLLIAGDMGAGDFARFSWNVEYAARVNWGFVGADALGRVYNQPGRLFMEKALAKWQRIVAEECRNAEQAARMGL